ncbi:preprotein translocase subunit YajC [Tumebacillus permanentifrigoris]|uniref:Preprotein translocase subunit YajC n=1 Tax=Tumebacillus permanentifrigoris TaxID=378543 RepID=A0A316D7R4_9BACL|nr:preprotein translocase subunit YajC [Tumebacillus permanentifrigoris]PWK08975.1 preprotein translocase subunit YajC [Tumebacillus permanentifrigoris]
MDMIYQLGPFLLVFVVFYFLLIRPQQKRQKERVNMLNQLKKGEQVVTVGGLHGTIDSIDDKTCVLKVSETTKLTFERSAISTIKKD